MSTDSMINNVVGAVVTIKVLEAGSKMMNKPLNKKKGKKQKGLLL
jgi:hypothetical protein